jgi:hypothetical protein
MDYEIKHPVSKNMWWRRFTSWWTGIRGRDIREDQARYGVMTYPQ